MLRISSTTLDLTSVGVNLRGRLGAESFLRMVIRRLTLLPDCGRKGRSRHHCYNTCTHVHVHACVHEDSTWPLNWSVISQSSNICGTIFCELCKVTHKVNLTTLCTHIPCTCSLMAGTTQFCTYLFPDCRCSCAWQQLWNTITL